jgi:hypothetical protein
LARISKRVFVLVVVIIAITVVVLSTVFFLVPDLFTLPQSANKIEIASVNIEPSSDWKSCIIKLTATNTYNSPTTVIGSKINGVNFGYSKLEIPPGQTQDAILTLSNLAITNSTTYDTKLTFTFDDGKYEVYSQSITPKKYVGSFMINGQSMNATSNSTIYSATIQNTGNIPLVSTKCTIGNFETSVPFGQNLMPKSTTTLNFAIPLTFDKGVVVNVTLEATFAEGSTMSANTSYKVN